MVGGRDLVAGGSWLAARSEEIVALIEKHQVIVLAGETGSGKTTQLPKLCLAAGRGARGMIACTQPRRIAARTVARRVATELGTQVGALVGFQVRFVDQGDENALVKFMTDGILLAQTQGDPWLSAYDTIILDEAHERSLNIDFLLGYLKRLLARRRDLKLIVTSATIDTQRFAAHFGGAPVIEVEGRTHPVEVRWRDPAAGAASAGMPDEIEQIGAVIDEITRSDPRGDILVFLPGEREIRDTHLALSRRKYRETEVLALYARLSAAEQDRVFRPGPQRRIVLATNVAETSLTVPRIRYVVDPGTARVKRYNPRNQLERLHVEPISQAAADQRKGRCGRVGPGICYRLYGEDDYAQRPRFTEPEILRSSLAGVILRMLDLKLGDPAAFPFLEAPGERALGDGFRRLQELDALDEARRLTATGRAMARLPIDVALARMLIEAKHLGVQRELNVLAAFLSVQDPRERPADARPQADAVHARHADSRSDFIGILRLWAAYGSAHEERTQSGLREWCRDGFLSFLRMREWRELHRQLLLLQDGDRPEVDKPSGAPPAQQGAPSRKVASTSAESRMPIPGASTSDAYEAIHRCLLSGWPTQVARKDERGLYRSTRERRFSIFPGSALAKSAPNWLLAGQIIDLKKVYGMLCARVEPQWIEQQAAHLIRKSWRDPHWSRKRGAVLAHEQVSLFGLLLAEQRVVQFSVQDPAQAHAIFLREALARGEIEARADFVRANARVLAQAHETEAKLRRIGLMREESELAAFFAGKLPTDICTSAALDAWYRRATPAQQAALHWSLADVLDAGAGAAAADFPARLDVAGHALGLSYRFVPGDAADGVTLLVPLAFVNAVPPRRCEWLVPGLLADKVAEAIRSLPRALRRNFVPAPDFARAFTQAEAPRDEPLLAVLSRYLQRVTGVAISAADFDVGALPAHLQMNFRVFDERGQTLVEGRDLAAIQSHWTDAARMAFSHHADVELTREDVASFDFEEIPERIVSASGLTAFPALVDLGESVALRVFERADEALAAHRRGVERLLRRTLADRIKQAQRQLPIKSEVSLRSVAVERNRLDAALKDARARKPAATSSDSLRTDLIEGALRERLAAHELAVRDRAAFEALREAIARELFPAAIERLALAEAILAALAELRPLLEPPLMGFAKANYDDLHEQLDALLAPRFLCDLDRERLAQFPRYLKAMSLRAQRLRQDPARDQARMLGVQLYWREVLKARARDDGDPRVEELRWLVEELRVSSFAQELGTRESVSPKRLAKLVEALKA
ncbi:ATP-dependent RNA helicase HrpA [Dokdonella sp.]|uniref:ATP-dependent RNA helicase HrpA n=1 Tax=Dokdonella sp. TaxID=2291710 RepID=UPI0025B91E07|nr:ATP-dependent RNA helicase HrpA [Dokdonella sp.]MBX3689725.1 ATP-dependent RNA helicase HrpA [Dokdonella sp.]